MKNRIEYWRNKNELSQSQLGELVGLTRQQISRIENGGSGFMDKNKEFFAKALNCTITDLMVIDGLSDQERTPFHHEADIPVLGRAGAGEVHFPIDDYAMGDGMYHTERPPGLTGTTVALEVRGDSMEMALHDGDLVFYQRDVDGVPPDCYNKQCVVQVKDGPVYLKILKPAIAQGYFHLHSINTKNEVIPDQQIEWASKILFIKKA